MYFWAQFQQFEQNTYKMKSTSTLKTPFFRFDSFVFGGMQQQRKRLLQRNN